MYRIDYLERGTKSVPDRWAYGVVISTKQVPCDYKCGESGFATEKEAQQRVNILKQIRNREYHSFKISEYELTPIVGYSIIGFSCNMFHTKQEARAYGKRHKREMPNGFFKADGTIDDWYIQERRQADIEDDIMHPTYLDKCPKGKHLTQEQEEMLYGKQKKERR